MRLLVFFALPQLAANCVAAQERGQQTWKRIHASAAFSFDAPSGSRAVPVQGFDSYVAAYVADGFSISFDYGRYSSVVEHAATWDRIDHRISRFESGPAQNCPAFPGDNTRAQFEANFYIERSPKTKLTIYGCARDQEGLRDLQRVFRSVRFGSG